MLLTQSNIEYKITEAAIDLEINVGMYTEYVLFGSKILQLRGSYNLPFLYNFNNGVT